LLFTNLRIPGIITIELCLFCLTSPESMSLTDGLHKVRIVLSRGFSSIYLLGFITIGFSFTPSLHALCPTVCTDPSGFCIVRKGIGINPIPFDDFEDTDNQYGIVTKEPFVPRNAESEAEKIFQENPEDLKSIDAGALLTELQEEGNVYLGLEYGKGPRISLEEAIYLALRDNEGVGFGNASALEANISEGITTAYLNREVQIEQLRVAENSYRPQWDTTFKVDYAQTNRRDKPHSVFVTMPSPGIVTSQKLKTGGVINMEWTNAYTYSRTAGQPSDTNATTGLRLAITQPLLKGAGFIIGTLPLTDAYLTEETNINSLRGTVITVVTQAITTYREYKRAIDQFEIDKRSIEESRQDLEKTKLLVAAGIRAEADIVEGQYSLATREFSFQDSQNTVDQARIAFLRVLNMDTSLNIVPDNIFVLDIDPKDLPTVEELMPIAYLNAPDYLNQLIALRKAELSYIQARNNCLWQLDFNSGITAGASRASLGRSNQNSWDFRDRTVNVGLTLTVPFNSLTSEQGLIDAKVGLRTAKINVQKSEQDLTARVKDTLREIKKNIIQVKLAKLNVMLAKQRLVQKRLEIEAGSSSGFELTSVLDQFITTESQELSAQIALMNSLSTMDALLGTTLDTWNIDINRRTDNVPKLSATLLGKLKVKDELKVQDESKVKDESN